MSKIFSLDSSVIKKLEEIGLILNFIFGKMAIDLT